jgi:hypothetical protein
MHLHSLLQLLIPLIVNGACTGSTYSYGSGVCSSCPAGSTFISETSGCYPASSPTDTAFYLSGSESEGVSAFSTINAPSGISYTTSVFGVANGSITFDSGSYLRANGAALPTTLPSGGDVPWTVSAWVKCAAPSSGRASALEWGLGSSSLSGTAPLTLDGHRGKRVKAKRTAGYSLDLSVNDMSNYGDIAVDDSGRVFYFSRNAPLGCYACYGPSFMFISHSGTMTRIPSIATGPLSYSPLYSIHADSLGTLYMKTSSGSGYQTFTTSSYHPACDSTWHHVSLSYTPFEYLLSAYIDGVLFSHRSLDGAVNLPSLTSSTLNIGWDGNGEVFLLAHSLTFAFTTALSLRQKLNHFLSPRPRPFQAYTFLLIHLLLVEELSVSTA